MSKGAGVLDGKAVVLTGAGRGLGAAYAVHAALAGASVVVNDIDGEHAEAVAAKIIEQGGRAVASVASVADPDQAGGIVRRCLTEFGRIDGLVNNAALHHMALPWEEDPGAVGELIEVNLLGVVYCGIAAAQVMHEQRAGSIVNISSGASFGQRALGTYAASKGAVASLTYSWALDLAKVGVRVNGVCPLAWTRMVERHQAAQARVTRQRTPDRVAPLITYLLSDRAAGITGQLIRFTGDQLHIVRQPAIKDRCCSVQTGRPTTSPKPSIPCSTATWNRSACKSNHRLGCAGPDLRTAPTRLAGRFGGPNVTQLGLNDPVIYDAAGPAREDAGRALAAFT